jgi:hypothetical protein
MGRSWQSRLAWLALALSGLGLVAELAYFFEFGRYNIDEGMHLNAGRLIFSDGLLPYRDFPFSQGPGGPYFYGLLGQLFEPTLWVGRLGSLAAGLVCFGAMLAFAWRSAGVTAALGVALLLTLELPSLWLFTQIRTEAGSMALATLAALAFLGRRDTVLRAALPAVLLVGATAFRLTYVVALLAVVAITAFELRARPRRLAGVLVIVGATGLLAALPMLAFADPSFFHLYVSQNTRAERLGWPVFPPSARFWFFTRPETGYHAVLLLLPLPLLRIVLDRRPGGDPERARALVVLLAAAALVYGPQLWFTLGFFQYFENAALLAILAIGIALAAFLQPTSALRTRVRVLAWVTLAWLAGARTVEDALPVWTDAESPTVDRLAPLREEIVRALPGGCEMLTFETHLAVESGCRVTPGLEYSYFSFFPAMPESEAARRGVLNRDALLARLSSHPPELVALTREGADRILGSPTGPKPPRLPGMDRYRHWRTLRLPIGPLHTFWNDVFVYAREDVPLRE